MSRFKVSKTWTASRRCLCSGEIVIAFTVATPSATHQLQGAHSALQKRKKACFHMVHILAWYPKFNLHEAQESHR
jgi:hypothetical protein